MFDYFLRCRVQQIISVEFYAANTVLLIDATINTYSARFNDQNFL